MEKAKERIKKKKRTEKNTGKEKSTGRRMRRITKDGREEQEKKAILTKR